MGFSQAYDIPAKIFILTSEMIYETLWTWARSVLLLLMLEKLFWTYSFKKTNITKFAKNWLL